MLISLKSVILQAALNHQRSHGGQDIGPLSTFRPLSSLLLLRPPPSVGLSLFINVLYCHYAEHVLPSGTKPGPTDHFV